MPGAARLGDLIGHAPPIPPVTAAALIGAALATTGRLLVGSAGLTSGTMTGPLSATGIATERAPQAGGDGVGVGGVVTGKIIGPCSGNVFVNGIPAARALIDMVVCSLHPPVPIPIVSGSSNVFINGMPAARLGDKIFCGAVNLTASGNVFIGGSAGGSGQTALVGPVVPEDTAAPLVRASVLAAAASGVPEITTDLFGPNVLAKALARNAARAAGLPMSFQATDAPCHSFEIERELRAQEIWPRHAPPDGVVTEDPATAYLRRSGAFEPNANTIEAKVGPMIRPAVLAVTPGGPYVLMAEGGHQMGEGIAQVRNGDVLSGGVGIAAGGLTALGGTAVSGAKPKLPLSGVGGTSGAALISERSVFATYPERTTIQMKSVSEQVDFLTKHVPGINHAQATSILENSFSRDTSVVFGGSRIRGNYNGSSDLDIGFGSLTERQAQRVIKSINEQGFAVPLERLTIVPGKSTATIERIISPEEFFQRSGVRAGADLRAGQPFVASGSLTFTSDGRIVVNPPGKI